MADNAPPFVHLHNHTTYSLLDGAQRIGEMCARAAEDGQPSIAITDHGNLFGVMEFGKQATRHGLKPIIGIEAYVSPGSRLDRQAQNVPGVGRKNYYHLILLAQDYVGYKNLIRLSTAGYLKDFTTELSSQFDGNLLMIVAAKFVMGPGDASSFGAIVPAPGVLALLGAAGLVGLRGRRRRR